MANFMTVVAFNIRLVISPLICSRIVSSSHSDSSSATPDLSPPLAFNENLSLRTYSKDSFCLFKIFSSLTCVASNNPSMVMVFRSFEFSKKKNQILESKSEGFYLSHDHLQPFSLYLFIWFTLASTLKL